MLRALAAFHASTLFIYTASTVLAVFRGPVLVLLWALLVQSTCFQVFRGSILRILPTLEVDCELSVFWILAIVALPTADGV